MIKTGTLKFYHFLACIASLALVGVYLHIKWQYPAYARALLACPSTSCSVARVEGFQSVKNDMRPTFNNAASNNLGSDV